MTKGNNRTTWTEDFRVRAYEADTTGALRPDVLCDYMQEAAAKHADHLGLGAEYLLKGGMAWVLSRLVVEIERPPIWQETVPLVTWPSGHQGIFATRDFLLGPEGSFARATTAWFLIDIARRRPVRLPESVDGLVLPDRPRALIDDFARVPPIAVDAVGVERAAGHTEIDMNGHVNHVRYLAWALDSMELDWHQKHRLRRVQVQYRTETRVGDVLTVLKARVPDTDLTWNHEIRSGAGDLVAQARTDWLPR
ncbi:MAG: medium-chain acyl-[acyl-carrier-protein] hydrolase [Rhodothermales bacterium]|jgi:medium-chain acyl-[acyl-carrier-protein] hydrolase